MSVLAIVSKAVFEKEARGLGPADTWATERYASANPGLESLGEGGALYLVTVRPGDVLWLVAVLEAPRFDGTGWKGTKNTTPIADVTALLPKLRFSTGKGIAAAPGRLGMSLQTPRVLTAGDERLFGAQPNPAPARVEKTEKAERGASAAVELTVEAWRKAGAKARVAAVDAIVARNPSLSFVRNAGADEVPVFLHAPSQALFHLVLGGPRQHGFSTAEWDAVYEQYRGWWEADQDDAICEDEKQLPKPYTVTLPSFLLAGRPFDSGQLELLQSDAPAKPAKASEGRKTWDYAKVAKLPAAQYLKYLAEVEIGALSERDVDQIEERLRLRGLRLPTDDEWEAAARAGGSTPFPAGTAIPRTPNTGENRFGFVDMGAWPEVVAGQCAYGSPPTRALRGGAAMCYPSQDCGEWTLMLSAIRLGAAAFAGSLHVRPMMELA